MDKVRMTIRIVENLDRQIEELAEQQGISKNAVIIEACREHIYKWQKEKQ